MSLLINLVLLWVTLSSFFKLVKGKDETPELVTMLIAKEKEEEGSSYFSITVTDFLHHIIYGYLALQSLWFTDRPQFIIIWLPLVAYMWFDAKRETNRIKLSIKAEAVIAHQGTVVDNALQALFYTMSLFVLCYPMAHFH